jgi:phosphate:Na+ symporter
MEVWRIAFSALAGLILFLYGIEQFSTEIQAVAGERFRDWLGRATRTAPRGALLGALATMLAQSSSATTIIAVGLVNAGTISFRNALGIVFGANVGTTVTGILVALKLTAFAPFFIVGGFALSIFGRRAAFLGRPVFYFGLVFFALALVSSAMEPLYRHPTATEVLAAFSSVPAALAAGFVFTAIVQSSAVTTGLVVLLASAELIDLHHAIPILLGANLGTTTTSLFASATMSLHARRLAAAHLVFNAGGVLLFLPVLSPFAELIRAAADSTTGQVAAAHVVFNGITAAVFLAAVRPLARVVEALVRGDEEEILFRTAHLGDALPTDTQVAFAQIEAELGHLLAVTERLFSSATALVREPSAAGFRIVEKLEHLNDYLDERVERALLELSARSLTEDDARRVVTLVRISNTLEHLGDAGTALSRLAQTLHRSGSRLPEDTRTDLDEVGQHLSRSFAYLRNGFPDVTRMDLAGLRAAQMELRRLINDKYRRHMAHMRAETAYAGSAVVELLSKAEGASALIREIRKQLERPAE